jgi:hypothetical protein
MKQNTIYRLCIALVCAWLGMAQAVAQFNGCPVGFCVTGHAVSGTLPVATFQTSGLATGTGQTQTVTAASIGAATPQRFIVIVLTDTALSSLPVTSFTLTPNVGSAITLSQVVANNSRVAIFQGVLLSDADTATTANISITLTSNPGVTIQYGLWTVPSANLNSQTATGSNGANTASGTTISTTFNTTAGGFIIAGCRDNVATTYTFTGTETYTLDYTAVASANGAGAHANGITTNAANSITCTATSGALTVAAAAWR